MKKYFYLLAAFFSSHFLLAQSVSATFTTGCAPLVNDVFTGISGATNPQWDFGDQANSNLNNPTHTYVAPGTYTVHYTATTSSGAVNQQLIIKVFGKPSPSFTATTPTAGCVPLSVTFTSSSTGGGGSAINTWQWTYGDGGTNSTNSANQTYVYSIGGQFNVTLKVIDANGCDSSLTKSTYVIASVKPSVFISTSPSPASACTPPLTVTFNPVATSHSPVNSTLTYSWSFGSTSQNPPAQTYTAQGSYPVVLTVKDANNCTNSYTTTVSIQTPTAVIVSNDTVCMRATFGSTGSSSGGQTWDFGDGSGLSASPSHTYTAPGNYTVKLTVSNPPCTASATMNVNVQQPVVNFTVAPKYECGLPAVLAVTNTSAPSSSTTYTWTYYNPFTQYSVTPVVSHSVSPSYTITHLDTNRYTVNTLNIMDSLNLTITTAQGCKARRTIFLMDTIFLPTARFVPDKYEGCVPLTVNFEDSSRVGPHEQITSYQYNFGDGTTATYTAALPNPVHTYTAVGIYYPTLIIHTQNGCLDTSFAIRIQVGSPPVPSFSVNPTSVCIGDNVQVTNTTPSTYSVDSWHYYGDGGYYISSCSAGPNVTWPFTHATGPQNIALEACFRGCCATTTVTGAVNVKGPLAEFTTTMDCTTPLVYNFNGTISDATSWIWDFGDGNTVSTTTATAVSHTYAASGDYNVTLTASSATTGCNSYTASAVIHPRKIKAVISYDSLVCSKTAHTFNASLSQDVYTYGSNGYTWLWGDGTHPDITSSTSVTHNYITPPNVFTVSLIVKDKNGCPDTARKIVRGFDVHASFVPSLTVMCTNSNLTFTNNSTQDTAFTSAVWSFGDGATATYTSLPANTAHTYSISNGSINSVTVTLTETSALGCISTATQVINISRPNAAFTASSLGICSGQTVTLHATNSYPTMNWNFGDGATQGPATATAVAHSYTVAGNYSLSLSVTDAAGCSDTRSLSQQISVENYPVVYIASDAFHKQLCYPTGNVIFKDSSIVNVFNHRAWTAAGFIFVSTPTVAATYTAPGTYSITLDEWTNNNCHSSATYTLHVDGPVGNFTLTPSVICKGQSITFGIKDTSDVVKWKWDFGDGTGAGSVSPVTHQYNYHPPNGITVASVVFYSGGDTATACKYAPTHTLGIQQVIADFDRNGEATKSDTAHCLGSTDTFHNTSTGASTYTWTFGDGSASNSSDNDPTHTYTQPGTYSVSIFIKNNTAGCVDTLVKKMIIYPPFQVTAIGDSVCLGQPAHLNSSPAAASYTWSPPATLNNPGISNPVSNTTVTTSYSLSATNINGCVATATTVVFVLDTPHVNGPFSHTLVIGQTYALPGDAGPGYSYTWTPATDLSCVHCAEPVFSGTVNSHYVETVADNRGCFSRSYDYDITVLPLSSIDVPTAFTPNGDGANDVVYVAGWGIKKLNYFRIYNRWGELMFESHDLSVGWDGTYKGAPQNMETYVYEASAMPYISDEALTKKGYIKLIR